MPGSAMPAAAVIEAARPVTQELSRTEWTVVARQHFRNFRGGMLSQWWWLDGYGPSLRDVPGIILMQRKAEDGVYELVAALGKVKR